MRITYVLPVFVLMLAVQTGLAQRGRAKKVPEIYPTAILEFAARGTGMREKGKDVTDILFAHLAENPELLLVERADLDKVLKELTLNLSGVVAANQANQIGQLTGAKVLITGSVFKAGKKTYIVAKIIGTETGRVLGSSVNGTEDIETLTEKLAAKVGKLVEKSASKLVAAKVDRKARLAQLRNALAGKKLPDAVIKIAEVHIGRAAIDPAAETEMTLFYRELGGKVIDHEKGNTDLADLTIKGEGFSEFAVDIGALKSVKARLEVKVLNRAGEVVAIDRQTTVTVDLTELKAGKAALQEAAARIAERLLPKLAK